MSNSAIWKQEMPQQLALALVEVSSVSDMQDLLRDLLTEKEIIDISARLEAACMLKQGESYTKVMKATKLSSRTVARISDWLKNGEGGYEKAIGNMAMHHSHIRPVRD